MFLLHVTMILKKKICTTNESMRSGFDRMTSGVTKWEACYISLLF